MIYDFYKYLPWEKEDNLYAYADWDVVLVPGDWVFLCLM